MAANYNLVTSQSTIQVLSPTVVQDVVAVTIQTVPSLVIATLWVTKEAWDAGTTSNILTAFAANIEQIMASPNVVGATEGESLDASGLLQTEITFVVGYTPPGSPFPPATVDVPIIAKTLAQIGAGGSFPGVDAALSEIDNAYQQLQAAAGVQNAPASS